jgi:DNA repair protein RadA/Sms
LGEVSTRDEERVLIGIPELDRVLGGGMVHGGLVLVGGDPGIGKSTLLLQALGRLAQSGKRGLYVSAEESLHQVQMRASRLGIDTDELFLLAATRWDEVAKALDETKPDVLVLDSVQTVGCDEVQSATGSVSQIRAVTQRLMDTAKGRGISTFVVGHVTKEGAIAGPKVMEHMVDTVLYFEGERGSSYRILRSHKNRFGAAAEIGVFEMQGEGLAGVANPSELFLAQRASGPGSVVVASLEGSRPILLEVQALTTPTVFSNPRRTTVGIDPQRVAMLCAVLERHAGLSLAGMDVYVNVAGGVRLQETAADLGVCIALASALRDRAPQGNPVVVGEVGLSGEVRAVSDLETRAREAASLGFERCLVPRYRADRVAADLPLDAVRTLSQALDAAGLA